MKNIISIMFALIFTMPTFGQVDPGETAIVIAGALSNKSTTKALVASQATEVATMNALTHYINKTNEWMDKYNRYLCDTTLILRYAGELFGLYLDTNEAIHSYESFNSTLNNRINSFGDACYAPLYALRQEGARSIGNVIFTTIGIFESFTKVFIPGKNQMATATDRLHSLKDTRKKIRQLSAHFRTLERQVRYFDPVGQWKMMIKNPHAIRLESNKNHAVRALRKWKNVGMSPTTKSLSTYGTR